MYYYTISNEGILDSISDDYCKLKNKFPEEIIYEAPNLITSIYVKDNKRCGC